MNSRTDGLKALGGQTSYSYEAPNASMLEVFPNPDTGSGYSVSHDIPNFTSLCPKTGQPDFAHLTVHMVPDRSCVETKSLKLYLFAYRMTGAFMEDTVNRILRDLVATCSPKSCSVYGRFEARGGIATTVSAEYRA